MLFLGSGMLANFLWSLKGKTLRRSSPKLQALRCHLPVLLAKAEALRAKQFRLFWPFWDSQPKLMSESSVPRSQAAAETERPNPRLVSGSCAQARTLLLILRLL